MYNQPPKIIKKNIFLNNNNRVQLGVLIDNYFTKTEQKNVSHSNANRHKNGMENAGFIRKQKH